MTKILVNNNGINTYVIPTIDDGIDELVKAITNSENLDVPYGFSHKTYLKNLANAIREQKNECIRIKDKLRTNVGYFNTASADIVSNLNNIEDVPIKKRNSIIS